MSILLLTAAAVSQACAPTPLSPSAPPACGTAGTAPCPPATEPAPPQPVAENLEPPTTAAPVQPVTPSRPIAEPPTVPSQPAPDPDAGAPTPAMTSLDVIAEPQDEATHVFDQDVLHTFDVEIAPDDLAKADSNPGAEEYVPGRFTFEGTTYEVG